ncbi:MAG: sigma-70 family RNA polymerase sigma factor [Chloroflexi bacterium]|nr:sigma-70 family RNA polymerase sigma factor [Chloroflexota bacterium]
MDSTPMQTGVTIAQAIAGDQTAYQQLYEQYAAGLYRLCYGLLLNRQDAEDVAQEAFVYAFKNLQRYDSSRAAFKTWLYTIAVSRCRNLYRRHRHPLLDLAQIFHLAAPCAETPEAAMAQRSAQDAVTRALGTLSPRLREALVLRYGHGLTYREIADMMGCPQKTAESRVRLAHERLRDLLQPALLEELYSVEFS